MNTRKIFSFFVVTLVGLGTGYFLTNSVKFGFCKANTLVTEASCINFYERLGDPLFYGMSALAFIFIVLFFKPLAFPSWKKFAIWFIPLATLMFIFYSEPGSGDYFSPYPEQVFQWVSIAYVVISLFIIVYKSLKKDF